MLTEAEYINLSQLITSNGRTTNIGYVLFKTVVGFAAEMEIKGIISSFLDVRFQSKFASGSFSAITNLLSNESNNPQS